MISPRNKFLVMGMLYIVQFERDPRDGIARVLAISTARISFDASPHELLAAIEEVLPTDEKLAQLVPQPHSEAEVRRFLAAMAEAIRASPKDT